MSVIPSRIETQPDVRVTHVKQVTAGRTVAGFASNLTHLAGNRGLRYLHQHSDFQNFLNDIPPTAGGGAMTVAPRLRWVIGPTAVYLWVWAVIAAERTTGTNVPLLRIHLEDPAGVVLDGPLSWTESNGTLPVDKYSAPTIDQRRGSTMSRDRLIHTGWNVGIVADNPRLYNLKTNQGLDAVLRVETAYCRVYSLGAAEINAGMVS